MAFLRFARETKTFRPLLYANAMLLRMARQRKPKGRSDGGNTAKKGDGRIVCALCGRTIKDNGNPEQPVIYSICATCKKLPYRNPSSTASLN
jgi:hypothetical protein